MYDNYLCSGLGCDLDLADTTPTHTSPSNTLTHRLQYVITSLCHGAGETRGKPLTPLRACTCCQVKIKLTVGAIIQVTGATSGNSYINEGIKGAKDSGMMLITW